MIWLALAAQLSAPVPANLRRWFSYDDMPAYFIERAPGTWVVGIRVSVGPDGAVQGCSVESSSGVARLDELTCKRVEQRAKFAPARSDQGAAALGVYRTSISWAVAASPFEPPNVSIPDVDVSVQDLPPGVKSPALVRVMFEVDRQGRVGSCTAEAGDSLEHVSNILALVPVACDQLTKLYKPVPAKDATGNAAPSIQDAIVRFSVQSQAAR